MKTCKLLLGGLCVGDTFHFTPVLNRLMDQEGVTKFIWMTGTFSHQAIEFLQQCFPIEPVFRPDPILPMDIGSIVMFQEKYLPEYEKIEADLSVTDYRNGFSFTFIHYDPTEMQFRNLEYFVAPNEPPCIIIQPRSRNNWKDVPTFAQIDWQSFGLPFYTVGLAHEELIPGSIDFRGKSFIELAPKVLAARVVVGVHSAVACFTFYTPTNLVACRTGEGAYLRFGDFKKNAIDLMTPTPENPGELNAPIIIEAVKSFLGA